jgi:hypothetical protein
MDKETLCDNRERLLDHRRELIDLRHLLNESWLGRTNSSRKNRSVSECPSTER